MTPAEFAATYRPTALEVKAGTGIDDTVLLAQWANETAWGQAVFGNNLGNIRCSPTSFCQYATLSDFATSAIGVFHQPNFAAVLASTSGTAEQQLAAIVASPWSGQHYGGSLAAFYDPLQELETVTQADFNTLVAGSPLANIVGGIASVYKAVLAAQQAILSAVGSIPGGAGLTPAQQAELDAIHAEAQQSLTDLQAIFKQAA